MGDSLWDLGLSDAVLVLIFAVGTLLPAIAVAVWASASPERAPEPERDHLAAITARDAEEADVIAHSFEDEAGRTDPSVTWTR